MAISRPNVRRENIVDFFLIRMSSICYNNSCCQTQLSCWDLLKSPSDSRVEGICYMHLTYPTTGSNSNLATRYEAVKLVLAGIIARFRYRNQTKEKGNSVGSQNLNGNNTNIS